MAETDIEKLRYLLKKAMIDIRERSSETETFVEAGSLYATLIAKFDVNGELKYMEIVT